MSQNFNLGPCLGLGTCFILLARSTELCRGAAMGTFDPTIENEQRFNIHYFDDQQ